jgi:hypothetical protein
MSQPRSSFGNELGFPQTNPTLLYSDNQPAIRLVRNPEQHLHTKHIDVPYHVIREHQANHDIEITYLQTQHQLADLFTEALTPSRFFVFRDLIGVHRPS